MTAAGLKLPPLLSPREENAQSFDCYLISLVSDAAPYADRHALEVPKIDPAFTNVSAHCTCVYTKRHNSSYHKFSN